MENDLKFLIREILKICDHKTSVQFATDCAEHVFPYFKQNYPLDMRPYKAIEAGRLWLNDKIKVKEARIAAFSAHQAAREVDDSVAIAIARSAGHAAATVHVKTHAIHAANYAVKAIFNTMVLKNFSNERKWQYQRLLEIIKNNQV